MSNPNGGHQPGEIGPIRERCACTVRQKFPTGETASEKAVEDQEEAIRMRDLLRRSIVALCALARDESAAVCERLADFKNSVQKATAIEEMEKSLSALRRRDKRSETARRGSEGDRGKCVRHPQQALGAGSGTRCKRPP